VGSIRGEGHETLIQGITQAAVHPVGTARDLHPGKHPQKPAGRDLLHLRRRLGGGGQRPRCGDVQTQLLFQFYCHGLPTFSP
ncbi:MAG: hypothetical protein JOZ71_04060, partial [Ktedonobacteraceae bacterium]|nr:hypothetical protein [Ktedonobacteraceae bacterium]